MPIASVLAGALAASLVLPPFAPAALPGVLPVQEDAPSLALSAGIRGSCRSFTVAGRRESCASVVYQQYTNGRAVFLVPLRGGVIAFSGGEDERTSPTDYVLHLDAVRVAERGGELVSHDAGGSCRVRTNRAADRFQSIACTASAEGIGEVRLDFVGDGKRADIRLAKPE